MNPSEVQTGPVLRLSVNGTPVEAPGDPSLPLLRLLRGPLRLTGPKFGCGEGECGACTVLLDGRPVRSCTLPLAEAAGHEVTTVEGLARDGRLHPAQLAFAELGAMQCGYCTPGMVLATAALLESNPRPAEPEVREALAGNLCRCCGYPRILRAVARAAELSRDPGARAALPEAGLPPLQLEGAKRGPWDLQPAGERDYFSVLPDGLVAVLEGEQQGWAASGGAWIHVAASGEVTAFAGKVDVGQDSRTALGLLVAEELRVPLASVRVVLGDTDYCPFDIGTFGSRSMPGAGEDLRTTAAGTRAVLESMAAERRLEPGWDSYRKLLAGLRHVEILAGDAAATPPSKWTLAGKPAVKPIALEMVTGRVVYPYDLSRPGMLHGRVLRPPAYGASLRSVDLEAARAVPGTVVVREGDFVGVAAPDPGAAARALEVLDARWDTELQPGERSLEEDLRSSPIEVEGWQGAFHHEAGDVDRALAAAPVRLSATYTTAYIAHAPLEPRAALAEWSEGRLSVWIGTQAPFMVRERLAEALGLEEEQVRVVVPPTGGGFGGKHAAEAAFEAARLAIAAGRPVKVAWSREEEFRWGHFRPAAVVDVESGLERDGRVTGWRYRNFNSGSPGILTPYEVPNQSIDFQPTASPLPQGSYRALAATANAFARESHVDEMAHAVDRDPLEFRLDGLPDERLAAVLRAAAERAGWTGRTRGGGRGMGIAAGVEKGGRVATCVEVEVGAGRRLRVLRVVTAYECGALVNPDTVRNQVEGGTVMALGGALFEAVHFDGGRVLNTSFAAYRVPRFTDLPELEVILLDRPDIPSAGAGETPLIALAPALANAVFEASGVRLRSLPLAPEGRIP